MFEEIIPAIWQGFQSITPAGVSVEFFWPSFLLVFAIIYTLLEKTGIFGTSEAKNKGAYIVISLVLAYFTASSAFATLVIAKITPQLGMLLVAIMSFLLIFAFLKGDSSYRNDSMKYVMYLFMFVGAVWLLVSTVTDVNASMGIGVSLPTLSSTDMGMVVAIIIVIAVLWLLFRGGSS
jgi:hypothetical protein